MFEEAEKCGERIVQKEQHHPPRAAQGRRSERPAELDLLLLCARWPQREEDRHLIRERCAQPLDWPRFLLLAQHHRLVPLVSRALHASLAEPVSSEVEAVLDELRQIALHNAHRALGSLAELRRVLQQLHAHGIPVRVLKGLPLALSVYGDIALRAVGDLDLLIDQAALRQADRILRGLGYCGLFQVERFTPRQFAFYRAHWRDIAYRNPTAGFEIDLHWRLFRNREMSGAGLCAATARDSLRFGGFRVDTLPRMENLLYLAVHGTFDGWLYFKSLADVAAQVRTMSEPELDSLAALAESHGILPEVSAALALVRRYLAMNRWSARLLPEDHPTVAHILRYANRTLVGGNFLAECYEVSIATTLAFEFGLRRTLRYRLELLLRVLFRARMWQAFPLPDRLFGLYPLLSPFEWLLFRLRRRRAKSVPGVVP